MLAFIGNLKIRAKIFLGFGILIAILAIMSGTAVVSFRPWSPACSTATRNSEISRPSAQEIERDLVELDQHVEKYAATGDPAEHEKVLEVQKEIAQLVKQADELATTDSDKAEIAAMPAISTHHRRLREGFGDRGRRAKLGDRCAGRGWRKLAAELENRSR